MHMVRCCSCLNKTNQSDYKPMHYGPNQPPDAMWFTWSDAMRCIWSDAMRCMWIERCGACGSSDAVHAVRRDPVHVVRCRSCLYKKRSVRLQIGACGPCDAVHTRRFPKRRVWKDEQKMKYGRSRYVSMVSSPNRVLTSADKGPRKRASFITSFVTLSKIFAWET